MTQKSQDPKEFLSQDAAQPSEKTAKIAFRGTEEYRRGLDMFATSKGESVQAFIEKAVRRAVLTGNFDVEVTGTHKPQPEVQYHVGSQAPKDSASLLVAKGESPWVTRLLAVLRSGNQIVTEAIQKNLEAFCLIPGISDVAGGNTPAPNLRPKTKALVKRTEGVIDATEKAVEESDATRADDKSGGKRA